MQHLGQHNKAHVTLRTTQQSTCNIYDSSFLSEHSYTAIFSFVEVDFSCSHECPFIVIRDSGTVECDCISQNVKLPM
jgi:hypothetical protein